MLELTYAIMDTPAADSARWSMMIATQGPEVPLSPDGLRCRVVWEGTPEDRPVWVTDPALIFYTPSELAELRLRMRRDAWNVATSRPVVDPSLGDPIALSGAAFPVIVHHAGTGLDELEAWLLPAGQSGIIIDRNRYGVQAEDAALTEMVLRNGWYIQRGIDRARLLDLIPITESRPLTSIQYDREPRQRLDLVETLSYGFTDVAHYVDLVAQADVVRETHLHWPGPAERTDGIGLVCRVKVIEYLDTSDQVCCRKTRFHPYVKLASAPIRSSVETDEAYAQRFYESAAIMGNLVDATDSALKGEVRRSRMLNQLTLPVVGTIIRVRPGTDATGAGQLIAGLIGTAMVTFRQDGSSLYDAILNAPATDWLDADVNPQAAPGYSLRAFILSQLIPWGP